MPSIGCADNSETKMNQERRIAQQRARLQDRLPQRVDQAVAQHSGEKQERDDLVQPVELPAEGSSTASPVRSTNGLMEIQKNRKIAITARYDTPLPHSSARPLRSPPIHLPGSSGSHVGFAAKEFPEARGQVPRRCRLRDPERRRPISRIKVRGGQLRALGGRAREHDANIRGVDLLAFGDLLRACQMGFVDRRLAARVAFEARSCTCAWLSVKTFDFSSSALAAERIERLLLPVEVGPSRAPECGGLHPSSPLPAPCAPRRGQRAADAASP